LIRCSECGREMSKGPAVECLACLRLFHGNCLNRVRVVKEWRVGRTSYGLCQRCRARTDLERVFVRVCESG